MSFESLEVHKDIIRALKDLGFKRPTAIQKRAIPLIKSGKDVIGISKTGSGKTAAFGIPIVEHIQAGDGVQALLIVPIRELAVQIARELRKMGKYKKINVATVYGGVSLQPQIERMAIAEIVVGTPGRLLDQLQRGNLDLGWLDIIVLDEADKMAEMGFIEDIEEIISYSPEDSQILLFGATLSENINRLKHQYMREPVIAETRRHVDDEYLQQFYYEVEPHEKFSMLVHLLKNEKIRQAIVFCSRCSTVNLVHKNLELQRVRSEMIHGRLSQSRRLKAIQRFNKGEEKTLVASPVAARGLDIKNVTHIINYDLSQDAEEYIHRIGRTARAGETGKAITLLSAQDYPTFNRIEDMYQLKVEKLEKGRFRRLPFKTRLGSRQPLHHTGGRRNFNSRRRPYPQRRR